MLVLHISAESVKRLQHICILDALRSPRTRTKMLLIGGGEGSQIPPAPFAIYSSPGNDQIPLRWLESSSSLASA